MLPDTPHNLELNGLCGARKLGTLDLMSRKLAIKIEIVEGTSALCMGTSSAQPQQTFDACALSRNRIVGPAYFGRPNGRISLKPGRFGTGGRNPDASEGNLTIVFLTHMPVMVLGPLQTEC